MKHYTGLLRELYESIKDGVELPLEDEDFATYHLRLDVDQDKLARLRPQLVEAALTGFGDFLNIGLRASYSESSVPIADFSDVTEYLRDFDSDADHVLTVRVDKAGLLRREFPEHNAQVVWFLSPERAAQEWSRTLTQIESMWFSHCRRIVFLLDKPGCHLEGDWLTVLGDDIDDAILRRCIEEGRTEEDCDRLTERARKRSRETRWLGGVKRLVPEHLICSPAEGSQRYLDIEGRLFKNCLDLIVCSLANLTEPEPENTAGPEGTRWLAHFEGQKQVLVGTGGLEEVKYEDCRTWFALYNWVYGASKVNEAMGILRNLLTLQPYDQATRNYSLLVSFGDELTGSVASHYAKFVGNSVEQYFAKLKESSAFFQGKIDALNKQVSDLIDAFLKNLLAVFGVVTGTVLVKALDTTAQTQKLLPYLFMAFSVYVTIVAVLYYLVSWKSYELTKAEYDKNMEVAKSFFTEEDLGKYVGTAFANRERLFLQTFRWTAGIYGVLLFVSILGIFLTHGNVGAFTAPNNPSVSALPSPAVKSSTSPSPAPPPLLKPQGVGSPTPPSIVRPLPSPRIQTSP